MSNQLQEKSRTLAEILADNRLVKSAEQQISHKSLLDQTNLGKEQTKDIHDAVNGVNADTNAATNTSTGVAPDLSGVQDLNATAESALYSTGTNVDNMKVDGTATGTPAEQVNKVAAYKQALSSIVRNLKQNKKASSLDALRKFASLTPNSTEEEIEMAYSTFVKIASQNPLFQVCFEQRRMNKIAEDVEALAEAADIPEEQAASALEAAANENPEMVDELNEEAAEEAAMDVAAAEDMANDDELMAGIEQLAANASNALGVQVTGDDIVAAAEETVALADELGVAPEELIMQAATEMEQTADVTEEDAAIAQAILDEAAANGIAPEEVMQAAAEELAATEEMPKAASFRMNKLASTPRADFVYRKLLNLL